MLRKTKSVTDIKDIAAFFSELVSRAREFLSRPVRIHFIADYHPERRLFASDIGEFLPFLRTALIDAAQNTVPNPNTTLHLHRVEANSSGETAVRIAKDIKPGGDDFFVITLGEAALHEEAARVFAELPPETKSRITLLNLPCGNINTRAIVSAVRILIKGERISVSAEGLRILQEKA